MTDKYQIEALLRPAVEKQSAVLAVATGATLFLFQAQFYMPPLIAQCSTLGFIVFAVVRYRQGRKITNYQKRLMVLPRYSLKQSKIPQSDNRLFIGKGFEWRQKHTQRLRNCLLPQNESYLLGSRLDRTATYLHEHFDDKGFGHLFYIDSKLNPFRPKPAVGGRPEIHGVGMYEREKNINLPLFERVAHMLVLGTTRVGKTRLCEVMVTQDIRRGDTVIVFDPKGDADLVKTMYSAAKAAGREDDLYIFHLAYPEFSARYNPLGSYSRITEPATRIANGLPNQGSSSAFKEFGWRFSNIITRALHFLGQRPSYESIAKYIDNIDALLLEYGVAWLKEVDPDNYKQGIARIKYGLTGDKNDDNRPKVPALSNPERGRDTDAVCTGRYLKAFIQESGIRNPVAEGLLSAFKYEKTYFDKIVSSLGPFLEKLTSGKVSELLSPNYDDLSDPRPIFDWKGVIRTNGIVYVGLAALTDVTVAAAVGNAMFSDLTAVAGDLYAHGTTADGHTDPGYKKINIHADEFNELIGDEFVPMLSKAGGAGYQVTAYTQTWSDVEARIGDRAKAEQIGGNFNTLAMMRVQRPDTAEILTDKLPKVQISQSTLVSSANHSSDPNSDQHYTSRTEDRITTADVPMLETHDLTRLPKGQAFLFKEGGQIFKIRLPLQSDDHEELPDNIRELTASMRKDVQTYSSDSWAQDNWWNTTIAPTVEKADFASMVNDDFSLDKQGSNQNG